MQGEAVAAAAGATDVKATHHDRHQDDQGQKGSYATYREKRKSGRSFWKIINW